MNGMNRTILTGNPLEWQLTNEQRKRIGLPPIEPSWRLSEIPCGLLADKETYIYTDGNNIRRVISAGETFYLEASIDVTLTEDGRLPPVKPGGKSLPLTAANLHKRWKTGVSIRFEAYYDRRSVIHIEDHTRRRTLLHLSSLEASLPSDVPGFAEWVQHHDFHD